jgi:hypothetical protein
MSLIRPIQAFSSKVGTGLRRENAIKQGARAPFRFNQDGKTLDSAADLSAGLSHRPQAPVQPLRFDITGNEESENAPGRCEAVDALFEIRPGSDRPQ